MIVDVIEKTLFLRREIIPVDFKSDKIKSSVICGDPAAPAA
jgi:hypothetical protein